MPCNEGQRWRAANDQQVSPTYVPDLVQAALNLLIDGEHGLWHLTNRGAVSWAGFAQMVAEAAGLDAGLGRRSAGRRRWGKWRCGPRYSALQSERGLTLAPIEVAVEQYLADIEPEVLLNAVNDLVFSAANSRDVSVPMEA